MVEYASILAFSGGEILSGLTSIDPLSYQFWVIFGVIAAIYVVFFKLN